MLNTVLCRVVRLQFGLQKSRYQPMSVYTPKADQLDKRHCVRF
jgi:hypothetical protein